MPLLYPLKEIEQPQCICCNVPLTVKYVLVDCVDLAPTRRRLLDDDSLATFYCKVRACFCVAKSLQKDIILSSFGLHCSRCLYLRVFLCFPKSEHIVAALSVHPKPFLHNPWTKIGYNSYMNSRFFSLTLCHGKSGFLAKFQFLLISL